MPYIITQSELNDDDYVHVDIYKTEFCIGDETYVGRNSYEVAIRIYVISNYLGIELWLRRYFSADFIEQNFSDSEEEMKHIISFDYWILSRKFNLTNLK